MLHLPLPREQNRLTAVTLGYNLPKIGRTCLIPVCHGVLQNLVYLMMSICPFFAARCSGDVPFGSVVSPFLGSSKAAHILLDSSSWTTCRRTRPSGLFPHYRLLTEGEEKINESAFLPRLCQTRMPGPEASSLHCPRCTGWTGAAAASQTGVRKHKERHIREK